jgi:hypothetical protein
VREDSLYRPLPLYRKSNSCVTRNFLLTSAGPLPYTTYMRIYHATQKTNLPSIRKHGVSVDHAAGKMKAVWGVQKGMLYWAIFHAIRRHGGLAETMVVIELDVPDDTISRFKGGLWYSTSSWPASTIVRVHTFWELTRSPTEAVNERATNDHS